MAVAVVAAALLCGVPVGAAGQSPLANPDAVVESTVTPSDGAATADDAPASGEETTTDETTEGTSTDGTTTDGTTTDGTTTDGTKPMAAPPVVPPPVSAQLLRTDPGARSAASQSRGQKGKEAKRACAAQRPPINGMLAIQGMIAGDDSSSWTRIALFIAACFAAIALVAFFLRRSSTGRNDAPAARRGRLETASTVVAIAGTLLAIANQFIAAPPPPQAAMTVRDVMPRITRGEYARRIGVDPKEIRDKLDRREVGNVALLELQLTGYGGKQLKLQYAAYSLDRNVSGTLLRGTRNKSDLTIEDEDKQTLFVPIWIGYPKSQRFEAQFRLIENDRIRQLTGTGPMKGSTFRYACARDLHAA